MSVPKGNKGNKGNIILVWFSRQIKSNPRNTNYHQIGSKMNYRSQHDDNGLFQVASNNKGGFGIPNDYRWFVIILIIDPFVKK